MVCERETKGGYLGTNHVRPQTFIKDFRLYSEDS